MKTLSRLKKLSSIAAVIATLALFPGISMAEKSDGHSDRARHNNEHSQNRSKSYNKDYYRENRHAGSSHKQRDNRGRFDRGYDKHNKHRDRGHSKHYNGHGGHAYRKYKKHYSGHDVRHNHGHRGYAGHDYGHRHYRDYRGFDNLRFMIGLHSDNLDIIFRD